MQYANFFYYFQKISIAFFEFRKLKYMLNIFNHLQYRQKILILDCFEFLSMEYKLPSFNANEFNFVSH